MVDLSSDEFLIKARDYVSNYFNKYKDKNDKVLFGDDVYVVWYCKTLQNHKALLSTPVPDGMYYEVTYNGDKDEIYFDAYKKCQNIRIDPWAEGNYELLWRRNEND